MALRYKSLEKITKGVANHRRIQILELLLNKPELSLFEVSNELGINMKTGSEHLRRLAAAGLVMKRYEGNMVRHRITKTAEAILKFLRILE